MERYTFRQSIRYSNHILIRIALIVAFLEIPTYLSLKYIFPLIMRKIKVYFFKFVLILITSLSTVPLSAQTDGALIPDFKVNDDATNYIQEGPSIGVDGQGNFVIVWTDRRNTPQFSLQNFSQRFAFDGIRLGVNFRIGQDTAGGGQITVLSGGKFIVAWAGKINGKEDLYAQRFFSNGTVNGNEIKINDTNIVGAYASLSDVGADSIGNFIVVWTDYRNGVLNQMFFVKDLIHLGQRLAIILR